MELIDAIRRWSGEELQPQYIALLRRHGGESLGEQVYIYSAQDVVERNETYETKQYCPGYLAIGDDGGGRAIVTNIGAQCGPVFAVDHGSMCADEFVRIGDDIQSWLALGAPAE